MVHNSKMQDVFFSSPFSLLTPQTNLLDQQVMQLLQLLHWSSGEQMWLSVRQKRSLESLSVSLSMKKQRTWVKALIHFCQFTCSALMRQVAKCTMSWTGQSCQSLKDKAVLWETLVGAQCSGCPVYDFYEKNHDSLVTQKQKLGVMGHCQSTALKELWLLTISCLIFVMHIFHTFFNLFLIPEVTLLIVFLVFITSIQLFSVIIRTHKIFLLGSKGRFWL